MQNSNQTISNCILQDANTTSWFAMSKRIILTLLFIMVGVYYLLGSNEAPIRANLPDKINIKFHHSASEEEIDAFFKKISEFGFSTGKQDDAYVRNMRRQFTYNSNRIYGRDLLKQIRDESIVEQANFKFPFEPGIIVVEFDKHQSLEEIQEFAAKFSRFDMRFSRRASLGNRVIFSFNDDLIEHQIMLQLLMDEENVEFVTFNIIMRTQL